MNLRIKKTALFLIILGLALFVISAYFGGKEYLIIRYGKKVEGSVVTIEEVLKSNDTKAYRFSIWYPLDNPNKIFMTPEYPTQRFVMDQKVPLSLYRDEVSLSQPQIIFSILLGIISGLGFLMWGLWSFFKNLRPYTKEEYLKLFGRKTQARFHHIEPIHNIMGAEDGYILYLEGIQDQRIFTSQPILDTRSIRSLEKTVFDVYYHPKKTDRYYIDLEKYFGKPITLKKKKNLVSYKK